MQDNADKEPSIMPGVQDNADKEPSIMPGVQDNADKEPLIMRTMNLMFEGFSFLSDVLTLVF